ncbi:MAG: ribosome maturation factor RimM, partial [Candidatus Eremiobacteraeota bacterium]|nr:ribosome maturation factor RimM [Candidatus Eremiobacteraeota bacterium]
YRDADLLDMQVRDAIIGELGTVRAVQHYPSCDMLVVGDKPWLIPLLAAYEVRVDQAAREIHVRLPAGFEEL